MNIRRAAPLVFAALCIGLSAFVLRGQFAAHPKPPDAPPREFPGGERPTDRALPVDPKTWHVATGPARREALTTIGGQLAAIRAGNADQAWFYQSRGLHRNFHSPQDFVATIAGNFPEFGHAASVAYGPVWADPTESHADVVVTVRGQNGRLARGYYALIRQDGGYKTASVLGGRAIREAAPPEHPTQ